MTIYAWSLRITLEAAQIDGLTGGIDKSNIDMIASGFTDSDDAVSYIRV